MSQVFVLSAFFSSGSDTTPPPLFLAAFPFDFVLIAWLEGVLVVGEDCRIIVNGLSLRNPHVVVLLLLLTTLVASEGSEPQFLAGSPV